MPEQTDSTEDDCHCWQENPKTGVLEQLWACGTVFCQKKESYRIMNGAYPRSEEEDKSKE